MEDLSREKHLSVLYSPCSASWIMNQRKPLLWFGSLILFLLLKEMMSAVNLELKPCSCSLFTVLSIFLSLIISLFVFPDWRLWPTDMGEISGAARNKGAFGSLFVCSALPCVCFFTVFQSAYSKCLSLSSISFGSLWLFTPPSSSLFLLFSFLSLTMLPVLFQCFLLTLSSLPSWLGATCPSLLSPSPSLLLHPSFPPPLYSLFLWWVRSREEVPLVFPQCTSAHPRCRLLDCDWLVWSLSSVAMSNPGVFINPTLRSHCSNTASWLTAGWSSFLTFTHGQMREPSCWISMILWPGWHQAVCSQNCGLL